MSKKSEKIEEYMEILKAKFPKESDDFYTDRFDKLSDSSITRLENLVVIIKKI